MKKGVKLLSILLILILTVTAFAACKPAADPEPLPDLLTPSAELADFFSLDKKIQIHINISEAELKKINGDYDKYSAMDSKPPIYRMCDVTIIVGDKTYFIDGVGIRMKGNTSRRSFYLDEVGIYDMVHFTFSFNETFDNKDYYDKPLTWTAEAKAARKTRTFLGMEKLDLNWNKNYDESHIRQLYAYELFREQNVLAPHINLASVIMKSERGAFAMGVWSLEECVDESFINRYLPENKRGGDLYKCTWGADLTAGSILGTKIGEENEDAAYFPIYDIKTNKETTDHSALKALVAALNAATPGNADKSLGGVLDVNYFLTYEAVAYIVGNPDDMRNNMNNFYIYFYGDNNQAIFIPYDFDRCFGITRDWNPAGDGMTSLTPFTRKTGSGMTQYNPIYLKTIISGGNETLAAKFAAKLNALADSEMLKTDRLFRAMFNKAQANYAAHITPDKEELKFFFEPFSLTVQTVLDRTDVNIDYKTYITLKLKTLRGSV